MKPRNLILGLLGIGVIAALVVANREPPPAQDEQKQTGSRPAEEPPPTSPAARPPASQADSVIPGAQRVPHYHATLDEARPLPPIVPASHFYIPVVARAYRAAARIPGVLAQQPCYCWCDAIGHRSLVDCFATDHGAG